MGMYEHHKTDAELERKGVWVDYGGFRVRIAKAGGANRAYLQKVELETKPIRRSMAAGTLSEDRARPIMINVFVDTIIMGWQVFESFNDNPDAEKKATKAQIAEGGIWKDGIEQPDGSLGEFTNANVTAALNALPAVFNLIKQDAMADDIYLESVREDEAKN